MQEGGVATDKQGGARPPLRLTLWGDFRITDVSKEEPVRLRGRKAQALLAYLALHPGKTFSRERLGALLWGDRGEAQARASLRQALSELKALEYGEGELLAVDRRSVSLQPRSLLIDVDELREAGERRDHEAFARLSPEHGERLLANLENISEDFDDWLTIERTRQADTLAALSAEMDASRRTAAAGGGGGGPISSEASAATRPHSSRSWLVAGLAALLLALITAYIIFKPQPDEATIAVLPFEDLSGGKNIHFAEGISEEIMTQLARDPAKTVVGRTSAWSVQGQKLNAQAIGQRLGVNFLVEGSVREAGQEVRVDVSLIRTRDGSRVWTERFSERADNVFAMQDRIAAGISSRFRLGGEVPVSTPARSASQTLYLTARGLVGTREAAKVDAAIEVLRQAVVNDPNFAPGWALLAKALIHRSRPRPEAMAKFSVPAEARDAIKRALHLDANSADAHLALGMALGPGRARRLEFERAVELDPGNSENWAALAFDYRFTGEYEREHAAWRRAATIDPLWARAFFTASETAWDLGYRKEASEFSSRARSESAFNAGMVRNDFGMRRGDFADAYRSGRVAQSAATRGRVGWAHLAQARALRAMNLYEPARRIWPFYRVDDVMWRMWHNQAPTAAELVNEKTSFSSIFSDDARSTFLFATLINAGRTEEAARLFDDLYKSPTAMADPTPLGHAIFVRQSALVYLALKKSGRTVEAAEVRRVAESAVRRTLSNGRVPNWYHAIAAQWQSASGQQDAALSSLERASREGWFYSRERDSFTDIALEPAFAALRKNKRFERVRAFQKAIVAREAAKVRL